MSAQLLWMRLRFWNHGEMLYSVGYTALRFYCRPGQRIHFPNSNFFFISEKISSNLFFKETLICGRPRVCNEIQDLSWFPIMYGSLYRFWRWSWSCLVPQWLTEPSLTHRRLISHVNCSLKKPNAVSLGSWIPVLVWRKKWCQKFVSPVRCFHHFAEVNYVCFY